MTTTIELPEIGSHSSHGPVTVPKGPRGLWGALASASAPRIRAKALPVLDTALLGSVVVATMFDYDPALAVSLGEELDVEAFFA